MLHHFLYMCRHVGPECIRLKGHDGEKPVYKTHHGETFIGSGLTFGGEDELMGPKDIMNNKGISGSSLIITKRSLTFPGGWQLFLLLPIHLIVSDG